MRTLCPEVTREQPTALSDKLNGRLDFLGQHKRKPEFPVVYNNMKMSGLDGLTVVKTTTEKASALILGGSFIKCAPHMKLEEGPGRIVWRDCLYPGWKTQDLGVVPDVH